MSEEGVMLQQFQLTIVNINFLFCFCVPSLWI